MEKKKPEKLEPESLLDFPILDEVLIWLSLALCVILMIGTFGFGGFLGEKVGGFLFGMFGFLAYLAPILLFFLIAFLVSNHGSILSWIKAASSMLLYFSLCTVVELITNKYLASRTFLDYYTDSARYKSGGGLVGGLLASMFCPAVGVAGAYVILLILIIICVVMITERSLLNGVKKGSRKVVQTAMDDAGIRRERAELRRERQRLRREQEREMEKRYLEEERQRLARDREEGPGETRASARRVNDFLLNDPKAPQVISLEEVHEVVPAVPDGKAGPEQRVFGEKEKQTKTRRPSFKPEPINLEPVAAEPLKTDPIPAFSEDFPIQRGDTPPDLESGFGGELIRMGKERAKQSGADAEQPNTIKLEIPEGGQSETENPEMPEGGQSETEHPEMPEAGRSEMSRLEVSAAGRAKTLRMEVPEAEQTKMPEDAREEPYEDIPPSEQIPQPEKTARNPKSSREEQEKGIAEVAQEIQEKEQEEKP
ncbi:MAG: DNA translocase FtsK 4TM domain-containing protein, partial [Candidatus Limivivens sp.]|nr:DNA translocase FtsK 4TM domain-containing protein [Candidatus Limivivens sp.]